MSRKRVAMAAGVGLVALVSGLLLWGPGGGTGSGERLQATGTVEVTEADLGFQAAGRIAQIAVREGATVDSGALLAALDTRELRARIAAADARLEGARSLLRELRNGARPQEVAQARAQLRAAEENLAQMNRDLERSRTLFEGGAISRQEFDRRMTAVQVATAERDRVAENLSLIESGARPERIAAQSAAVRQATADVEQLEAVLVHSEVRAPLSGIVTRRHREPGETVQPGAPVLTIMDPADRWVRIYVREDRIGAVGIGQRAVIRTDTYPDRTYDGEVFFIASEAEFTPKNVQTTEERVRLVYAVKVRITGDAALELKPGVPVDVTLLAGERTP